MNHDVVTKKLPIVVVKTQPSLCDFCSGPEIYTHYPVKSFAFQMEKADDSMFRGPLIIKSEADWGACRACASLIDAEQWDALMERAIQWFRNKYGAATPEAELRTAITDLHSRFRENRLFTH